MRLRLTPADSTFYDLFSASARHLVEASTVLAELVAADQHSREALAVRLRELEHAADDATHAVMRRLNSSFVTPFDREDIYQLASRLDDCMDLMDSAAQLAVIYRVGRLPGLVNDQVGVLTRAAELTAAAMPRLRSPHELSDYWVEINRLENQADQIHRQLLGVLFDGSMDAIAIMKVKEIVEELEAAADAFEHVAQTVESIAVKES